MKIIIINGPNLNLLGTREPNTYGSQDFSSYLNSLKTKFSNVEVDYFQSNIEGELIDKIQESGPDGILLNAAGYTHTSVSLRDAISSVETPVVEVHISNVLAREEFRHTSMIGGVCIGSVGGFGLNSYKVALQAMIDHLNI